MNAAAERFWAEYVRGAGLGPGIGCRVHCIGDEAGLCRRVLDLIRAGEKTGTFALERDFERAGEPLPRAGDYLVLTELDGRPDLVLRLTAVQLKVFTAVDERDAACEGPGLRTLAPWRQVHWEYWSRKLAEHGEQPQASMNVVCQRFELLHAPPRS
jgi:uncharacterized protein YhfF